MNKRFFSPNSIWSSPIPANPEIDPKSDHYIGLLTGEPKPYFFLNIQGFTIPVYEIDETTPFQHVAPMRFKADSPVGHGRSFENPVPIPAHAIPDPKNDRHMACVDYQKRKAWDMFYVKKREDGEWESFTGMTYSLDGEGIFDPAELAIKDGDSVHLYGPGRASGVPIIAGLIMNEEILAGAIEHKLAFASACNSYKQFVHPATWTDGFMDDGLPEGCIIQLDPSLNLDSLNLKPTVKTIARALQQYGAVNVDIAGATVLYAEGLYGQQGKSWDGILGPDDLTGIPLNRCRILKMDKIESGGKAYPDEKRRTLHDDLWNIPPTY